MGVPEPQGHSITQLDRGVSRRGPPTHLYTYITPRRPPHSMTSVSTSDQLNGDKPRMSIWSTESRYRGLYTKHLYIAFHFYRVFHIWMYECMNVWMYVGDVSFSHL